MEDMRVIHTDRLDGFSCVIKELKVGAALWRYSVSGNGEKILLALMSNVGGHYFAMPLAEQFSKQYRVIALSVPPLPSFSLSWKGIEAILKAEGVTCCDAIGHSNGGVHIQGLVQHRPDLVDKIIFSHSLTSLSQKDAYEVNASEVSLYRKAKLVMKFLPTSVILNALGGKFAKALKMQNETDTNLVRLRIKEDIKQQSKADVLGIIACMEDFLFHYTFDSAEYQHRGSRVLLLSSPSDKIVNPRQTQAMRKLCPGAREHVFETGGHIPMLTQPSEFYKVIGEFLTGLSDA